MNKKHSISTLAVAGVQKLVPYVPGKPIEELERELGLSDIVKLASNENPLGTNPRVAQAIQKTLPELTRYPDGNGFKLKVALAEKLSVDSAQITLGNGSNEILELVARTFLTPDLDVVFSQHAFAVYPIVTQAVGATARIVPAKDYGHDLSAMSEQINDRTRLVFIANPNNPTGTLLQPDELEAFIKALPSTVLCVLDEAYHEYVAPDRRARSIDWLRAYPNLIITRTFSKAYGLAGLRVGYSLSSLEIADLLNRVRQPFNNNMLALAAAETALSDRDYLHRTVAANAAGMQQLTVAFRTLGLEWIPSAGNFVSVDLGRPALPIYEALLRKGVIVRPVANYEMPNHLRVSIGTERENQVFITALSQVLNAI
ncbi:histidinol-phosphate transaminase [Methylomarinum vadi]|uniref:histidinol-phosphate transaminase n=1 Tax=Methylomarinum vadi TaxID=438855 RepID=UPI0004DED220|nr:histidinol-phosphate transaminase [Methylomarinum vadi]